MRRAEGTAGPVFAHRPLFTIAAFYGAAVVALGTLGYLGRLPAWQPPAYWHGHEMLFGFALAVVGGYLVTRVTQLGLGVAIGLWLLGRIAAATEGLPALLSAAAALAYPICLFVLAGLPLLRAAKRWRNMVFAPLLAGFIAAELLFQAGAAGLVANGEMRGLLLALSIVALLMFLMGGRVIAAAASGAFQKSGAPHRDMAQVRLEGAGVASLSIMAIGLVLDAPLLAAIGAAPATLCAVARLTRWRPLAHLERPELMALIVGYVWLTAGFALLFATGIGVARLADALHGVAAGALGTLAATMMTRVSLQRARRPIALPRASVIAIACISLAAAARLGGLATDLYRPELLGIAAALWAGGFVMIGVQLLLLRPDIPTRRSETGRRNIG